MQTTSVGIRTEAELRLGAPEVYLYVFDTLHSFVPSVHLPGPRLYHSAFAISQNILTILTTQAH